MWKSKEQRQMCGSCPLQVERGILLPVLDATAFGYCCKRGGGVASLPGHSERTKP